MERCVSHRPVAGRCVGHKPNDAARWEPREENLGFELPGDLREWVEPRTLLSWVEEEVHKLDWNNPVILEYLEHHPDYRPKSMLSILCFAYACEMLGGEEIVRACRSNEALRLLAEGAPFEMELRKFRRNNRELLERVLTQIFLRAAAARFGFDPHNCPHELEFDLAACAQERLDTARHIDGCE